MNKKKLKRREGKGENNEKKRSKRYRKKEKPKIVGAYGRTGIHILTPKYYRKDQRSCDGWDGGQGTSYFIASVVQWKEKSP
jgi:hypothetical protein